MERYPRGPRGLTPKCVGYFGSHAAGTLGIIEFSSPRSSNRDAVLMSSIQVLSEGFFIKLKVL